MKSSTAAEQGLLPPGSEIDLDNCHREPIQTPGGIQPHGALLAITVPGRQIVQRSENALERLGADSELLGTSLDDLVGADTAAALTTPTGESGAAGLRPRRVRVGDTRFDAFGYAISPEVVIVEFEPAGPEASAAALAEDVASMLVALQSATTSAGLLESTARWVRQLTGFDRVWVYRFEDDDHGVVVVEERDARLEPFLGLHFPARDIPPQARALFLANRVRFIPDSFAVASALTPLENPVTGQWPDLSAGILRAVSPMHLQYLQNMGTHASMSIALEVDGKLWGLISGHHYAGARVIEHRLRLACEVLGRVASTQLTALLSQELGVRREAMERQREAILSVLAGDAELAHGLTEAGDALLALCGADGAAVVIGQQIQLIGSTPREDTVRQLVDALPDGEMIFVTDSLAEDLPDLAAAAAPSAGLIALALARTGHAHLLWFGDEYVRSVTWGDSGVAPAKGRLSPSGSYSTWSESVTGHSRPWSRLDRDAVLSLRAGIGTVVLQQAEDLARANTELARSNADLQSFTWVVAHDLREPLRNMQSFLGFFLEDHGAGISADGLEQLATVRRLSDRMDALMDSLIDHARADHLKPEPVTVSLGELVDNAVALLGPYSSRGSVEVLNRDVRVLADRDAVTHILINLISNAMKYSPVDEPRIEVAAKPISETARGGPIGTMAISVRDFGIGIAPEFQDAVFDLFRRLHPRDAYGGGSGAGLAIARRLAERQGGELWLEHSSPDSGSVFCFSLPGA